MNWQRHERALKETIRDIKHLTKVLLIITIVLAFMSLLVVLSIHYPWIGIPFGFLLVFSLLYYANFWRN